MLLGLMIGDSLGNPCESLVPGARQELLGEVRDYLPNRHAGNRRVGLPSDDSQLALWTLESMLERGGLDPEALARKFCTGHIYGIGSTVREFIRRYKDEGKPWYEAGPVSKGNGALMRIAPVMVPHLRHPSPRLWDDTRVAAMLTHNDPTSVGACVAFVVVLLDLLRMANPPAPEWWLRRFAGVLREEERWTPCRSRVPGDDFEGPLWRFLEERVPTAFDAGLPVRDACDGWYSGAYLVETVPSALYILMRHGHDPEEAIVRAVNDTRDNDTVGAIVGAAVGALHGKDRLPHRWIEGLLGRTRSDDDGHAFDLIREACDRWVEVDPAALPVDPLQPEVEEFARRFQDFNIALPAEAVRRREAGIIAERGWVIQYLFGRDEVGEYIDIYASHRMTDDEHLRLRDGRAEPLPTIVTSYGYREEIPGDRERAEAEYLAYNRRVAAELERKGFGNFTMNQVLRIEGDVPGERDAAPGGGGTSTR